MLHYFVSLLHMGVNLFSSVLHKSGTVLYNASLLCFAASHGGLFYRRVLSSFWRFWTTVLRADVVCVVTGVEL